MKESGQLEAAKVGAVSAAGGHEQPKGGGEKRGLDKKMIAMERVNIASTQQAEEKGRTRLLKGRKPRRIAREGGA